ncbi:EboA domain-containing protein (plasmid) [Streptomyces sp. CA-142005]|uniref:EboA domain-containing protein n=1 Tax=Streptomyces sp. CA-142005 TaxID=3240052 RepID=UPI003D8B462A
MRETVEQLLTHQARVWLDLALADAGRRPLPTPCQRPPAPPSWEVHFAAAGRRCMTPAAGPDVVDVVRLLILHAAAPDLATVSRLYRQGTGAERRAVLRALPHLGFGDGAVPLVEDALRTNDTGLLRAAVGPYAACHLGPHAWRHAVLKCLFTGVPVAAVAGLERRAHGDVELGRMLTAYAGERTAAGRTVPHDLHRVLALTAGTRAPKEPRCASSTHTFT